MSKTIDMEKPDAWTDDDIIYLRDRGRLPEGYDLPENLRQEPQAPPLDETPYIGDVGTVPDAPMSDGTTGTFVDDDDFNEMPKSRLQAEARARNLDDSGTKADLVERLQAYEGQG